MPHSTVFESRGNIELLSQNQLACFASRDAPDSLVKGALSLFGRLRHARLSLAGGWQAPLEKKIFEQTSVDDEANYIYYLNKDINKTALNEKQQALLTENKLLLISPQLRSNRPSEKDISKRDTLIFSQINRILFIYIRPGGLLETYLNQLLLKQYQVFIFDHADNREFTRFEGTLALNEDNLDLLSKI